MLRIENLVKVFETEKASKSDADQSRRVYAVDDVSFDVADGELFTLLGPSGCGKTTTLRSIAGLEEPNSGSISEGDRLLFRHEKGSRTVNVPVSERQLGMVFQSYAIWPHMTVFSNVAFPLEVRKRKRSERPSKAAISEDVMRVLEVMELAHVAKRHATKLSGGQQQRLALARAIVTQPRLLLLDEPLSNLDAKLRESLRLELKRLQRDLGITSIYVTHDQTEALALSTKIAVMQNGKVVQVGKPREIYETPRTRFVAEFIGTSNFFEGTVTATDASFVTVETTIGKLRVVPNGASLRVGSPVVVSVRPDAVTIDATKSDDPSGNEWSGKVVTMAYLGDAVEYVVAIGQYMIRGKLPQGTRISTDEHVYVRLNPKDLYLVPAV